MKSEDYDAIVIGSGIGGLTAAALLARAGKRVLLVEQHWLVGGQTHAFKRKGGFSWDVGLHYVGDMAPGSDSRAVMDYITGGKVEWRRQPGGVDTFHYPGMSLHQGDSASDFEAALKRHFPGQDGSIERYFRDIHRAQKALMLQWVGKLMPAPVRALLSGYGRWAYRDLMGTTQQWLARHIEAPELRGILASQWGDYGLVPEKSAFLTHALIVGHYLNGAWYPVGGARRLAEAVVPVIEASGGKVQVQTTVERIVVEEGEVSGVAGRRFRRSGDIPQLWRSPMVISAIGAYGTYHHLLADLPLREQRRETQQLLADSGSAVTLYLGLKRDPAELGFSGENHWLYRDFDHNRTAGHGEALLRGEANWGFLSFPSMKDPQATTHTAEVVAHCPWQAFAQWADTPWRDRGEEYEALKRRISAGILQLVEEYFPGFAALVAYQELSTPLTLTFFTGHARGSFYGLPGTPQRYRAKVVGPLTPVRNCYLAGTDAASPGIVGAMMGGVMAVGASMGASGFPKLMGRI